MNCPVSYSFQSDTITFTYDLYSFKDLPQEKGAGNQTPQSDSLCHVKSHSKYIKLDCSSISKTDQKSKRNTGIRYTSHLRMPNSHQRIILHKNERTESLIKQGYWWNKTTSILINGKGKLAIKANMHHARGKQEVGNPGCHFARKETKMS